MSTRRSSSRGLPGNRESCSREHFASARSNPFSSMGERRGRMWACSRNMYGIQFPVVDNVCNTCSFCRQINEPVWRLRFASHRPGPHEGSAWRHLGAARFPEARLFLELCADGDGVCPAVLLQNYVAIVYAAGMIVCSASFTDTGVRVIHGR